MRADRPYDLRHTLFTASYSLRYTHAMQLRASPAPINRVSIWFPLLLSIGAFALTLIGTRYLKELTEVEAQLRFQRSIDNIQRTITSRLDTYTSTLRGLAGLFGASEIVLATEFYRYASHLKLQENYPGIQGVGFTVRVTPEEIPRLTARMREEGFPDFRIRPDYERPEIYSIVYLHPLDQRNRIALGYDMFTEEIRRRAMIRARDTAEPTLSGKVQLVQEITPDKQAGFLMYLPVYRGGEVPETVVERREKLLGFVYSPFRAADLFSGMIGEQEEQLVGIQVYDGPTPSLAELLYASEEVSDRLTHSPQGALLLPTRVATFPREIVTSSSRPGHSSPRMRHTRSIDIAGHRWTLAFYSRPPFERSVQEDTTLWLLLCGTAFSVLLGAAVAQRMRYFETLLQNEEQIKRSDERYRNFIQQSSEAIWRAELTEPVLIDMPTDDQIAAILERSVIAECNDAMARMHGYSNAGELLGRRTGDFLCATDGNREFIRAFIESGYRLGGARSEETDRDGTPRLFVNSLVGVIENDSLIRTWGTKQDVTDFQIAQESIKLHTQILNTLAEGVNVCTADGTIVYVNPALERLYGYESGELNGGSVTSLISIDQTADLLQQISDLLRDRGEWRGRFSGRRKDGSLFTSEARIAALELRSRVFWVWVQEDITDALRHEENRREVELERTRLLEAERRAREEAEHASRMKDEFLATLSHELRTPLNAILGWAQLTKRQKNASEQISTGLDIIERNARTQSQIIEDLLDMNRIISGKVRLDLATIDPVKVVQDAIETVRPAAEAKGLKLTVQQGGDVGLVRADPNRLHQVFWNVLSNAVKFTGREGSVAVTLGREESQVAVRVSDTGEGIRPEFLPFVFDRFRQADASTTRRHGGLGLGLAIVRHLTELHGGTVKAESDGAGKGASFTVTLPVAPVVSTDQDEAEPALSERTSPWPVYGSVNLNGAKVLVIDDQPDARELVKQLLEEAGAQVLTASSAQEGFQRLLQEPPSVIVSDIGMPDIDGYEFLRRVRRLSAEEGGRTPAVALTAFARSEDRLLALRAGYQSHVAKPVEPTELVQVVAAIVNG